MDLRVSPEVVTALESRPVAVVRTWTGKTLGVFPSNKDGMLNDGWQAHPNMRGVSGSHPIDQRWLCHHVSLVILKDVETWLRGVSVSFSSLEDMKGSSGLRGIIAYAERLGINCANFSFGEEQRSNAPV
ncbi:hypothetical protein LCGC14_2227910 [marine sediment metagenome]|uniref:Uncharacterized protein n=1 Tax=marine sediment metagenome TaxID=412755 RepID=A0A0F9D921_9ZZZZ